jgi:hypothetical protein
MGRRTIHLLLFFVILCLIWLAGSFELRAPAAGAAPSPSSALTCDVDRLRACYSTCASGYSSCLDRDVLPEYLCVQALELCNEQCVRAYC